MKIKLYHHTIKLSFGELTRIETHLDAIKSINADLEELAKDASPEEKQELYDKVDDHHVSIGGIISDNSKFR